MKKIKQCPKCRHANDEYAEWCEKCVIALDRVAAIPQSEHGAASSEASSRSSIPVSTDSVQRIPHNQQQTIHLIQPSAQLVLVDNPRIRFSLFDGAVIGRDADIDVTPLPGSGVISSRHAQVFCLQERWYIVDLKSTNHTYLNGKKLEPELRYEITDETFISLGNIGLTLKLG